MKKIFLSEEVMVSDPCYQVSTWCQHVLTNVLQGYYQPFCKIQDEGSWGERNAILLVVHENHQFDDLKWEMVEDATIGVDSGQAGIFSLPTYRNNDHIMTQEHPQDGTWTYGEMGTDDGDKFYDLMCGLTINTKDGWGGYDSGVVSSSGYGDGSYDLYVAKNNDGKIVGISIVFLYEDEDDNEINLNFYKDPIN